MLALSRLQRSYANFRTGSLSFSGVPILSVSEREVNRAEFKELKLPDAIARSFAVRLLLSLSVAVPACHAQGAIAPGKLDPARDPATLRVPNPTHLREQFVWTKDDAAALNPAYQSTVRGQDDKIVPHYFRAHFSLDSVPRHATLYIAGPRAGTVFLNGTEVLRFDDDGTRVKGLTVITADAAGPLRRGVNTVAIEEVRGHSSLHTGASPTINQVTYGEVLAVKIVPRSLAVDGSAILISDPSWRSILQAPKDWQERGFNDTAWPHVQSLGVLGSKSDFLQWNADAGLYAWPGYSGMGSAMRTYRLPVAAVLDVENPLGTTDSRSLVNSGALKISPGASATSMTLDFGREVSGRLHLTSGSGETITVESSYGESVEEAEGHPYLGRRDITVPPHGEVFGPKSAFRYVHLTFPPGASQWSRIDVEGIVFPVRYLGSFESSDPMLNRIWETGAYTAHLCMQEGIWDAPKRDRGQWMGDLDVTGRVISSVFADKSLMERTMEQVIGPSPVTRDVNTIAGYSALWITGQADFYRHIGDIDYLRTLHPRLLELLGVMDREIDSAGLFTNPEKHKIFVDWSPGFSADTPEARAATQFEFYLAYQQAAFLLDQLNDATNAARYRERSKLIQISAESKLLDTSTNTFGQRWQTNAMAVVSGAATSAEQSAIWSHVLDGVAGDQPAAIVTPYYGFYVLSAMAKLDHRSEALDWMRRYWGGMIAEGATSFWEAYDPLWPKQNFHASLEADGKKGYYVSLSHGWASGPTAWLMQQILGIEPTGAGFRTVTIRPDLAGLSWARGAEPTPHGLIHVFATPEKVTITLPVATTATVSLPFAPARGGILQNGKPAAVASDADGARAILTLSHPGQYIFTQSEAVHP